MVGSLSPGIEIHRSIAPVYTPGFCTGTLSILSRMGNYTYLLKDCILSRLYSSEFINMWRLLGKFRAGTNMHR